MNTWIQQHRVSAVLSGLTVLVAAQLWVSLATGFTWSDAVFRILLNAAMGAGFLHLVVRYDRQQKASLATRGILVHVRRPGSRPGSLEELWAGGTATCRTGQLVFQKANPLPGNLTVQTFSLPDGTLEVAADAASLARINQELFAGVSQAVGQGQQ